MIDLSWSNMMLSYSNWSDIRAERTEWQQSFALASGWASSGMLTPLSVRLRIFDWPQLCPSWWILRIKCERCCIIIANNACLMDSIHQIHHGVDTNWSRGVLWKLAFSRIPAKLTSISKHFSGLHRHYGWHGSFRYVQYFRTLLMSLSVFELQWASIELVFINRERKTRIDRLFARKDL